ncbi:hypothetical protein F511_36434 [Dorcoceras hygrometricum]|uniref:Uncharacterized protein n=1 Tax=Dorcoceras hygrometricum TaxID=472368 RepID=A0A2Z7CTA3_9LAMI|nr:hypothetical protein F511_36434 [Dorcoceras hygrometricum]
MHASYDPSLLPAFGRPTPTDLAGAPPAGPPPGPAGPNMTSPGSNHEPHGSNEASQGLRLSMSKKIEGMKAKKQKARESHVVCHKKFQDRIQEAEDSMQAQHLIIEALVEEKDSLLQTIQVCKKLTMLLLHSMMNGRKNRKNTWRKKRFR